MKQIIEMILKGCYEVAKGFSLIVWYFRRQLWFLTLVMIAMYLPLIIMPMVAFAPRAEARLEAPKAPDISQQDSIENYARTIFGKDAKVMIAISHNECGLKNPQYPSCIFHTGQEYSIGWSQVNIQSAIAKVHFDRIPGLTLEDKIIWLKNPYNNVLFSYWIFKTSGFTPWSVYTSGRYLNDL
jgi:hypothetical protein